MLAPAERELEWEYTIKKKILKNEASVAAKG